MAWNRAAIASARRAIGYSQPEFAKMSTTSVSTYQGHELDPEQFRLRELQSIADRLSRKHRLILANAIVETIFGEGMEVRDRD